MAAGNPSDPLVEMRGVTKTFGGLTALDQVDLTLEKREVLALLGDNGAGKSTLMNILSGVYPPTSGSIHLGGKELSFRSPKEAKRRGIGMMYQDLALVGSLSVWSNVFLGEEVIRKSLVARLVRWLDKPEMRRRSRQLLEELGIPIADLSQSAQNLSGGQRAAVAIAKILAVSPRPRIVIMDEPTAALGVKAAGHCAKLIGQLKASGISVILITHRIQDAFALADRVMVLMQGRKVLDRGRHEVSPTEVVDLLKGGSSAPPNGEPNLAAAASA